MLGTELSPEEFAAIIAYAGQKFAEERYPLSPGLRPVREALAKLDPKPEPMPLQEMANPTCGEKGDARYPLCGESASADDPKLARQAAAA
jgi:hypothetical protein